MATVIMAREFAKDVSVDGSVAARAYAFIRKLIENPATPGLHIEPVHDAVDDRVRTGRVNDNYRAVLFQIEGSGEPMFIVAAIAAHDVAYQKAARLTFHVNPVNGVLELLQTATAAPQAATLTASPPKVPIARPAVPSPPVAVDVDTAPQAEARVPLLVSHGLTEEALTGELGLAPDLAAAAVRAEDEDQILEAATGFPDWQADAVLDLFAGGTLDDVRARLQIERAPEGQGDEAPTDAVARAMEQPASKMTFVSVTDEEVLKRVLSGSFAEWRIFLHPEQRRYVEQQFSGPFRLSGGAGTGKTVVAMHRAVALVGRGSAARRPRVVLTTFTTSLAQNLDRDLQVLDPTVARSAASGAAGLYVVGIDRLAREIATHLDPKDAATAFGRHITASSIRSPLGDQDDGAVWEDAIGRAAQTLPPEVARHTFFQSEYRSIILAQGIEAWPDYAGAARQGRGVRLNRAHRRAVWDVVETYRRALEVRGQITFAEVASIAARGLDAAAARGVPRPVDHLIVDEAQDLHAPHWRLIRALVEPGPNDLFICDDAHQRIYGERLVLKHLGIAIQGRSRRLTLNYRTTAQVLEWALARLAGVDVADLEESPVSTLGYRSAMTGPKPRLVAVEGVTSELDAIASQVRDWQQEDTDEGVASGKRPIAVLTRSGALLDTVARGLQDRGVPIRRSESADASKPLLLTMASAKGLEFSRVIIAGAGASDIPARGVVAGHHAEGRPDSALRERFLLYVAATRARDRLTVTWSGEASELLRNSGGGSHS